jgi:glycosyltransferase involved in cell wall biosynthesis
MQKIFEDMKLSIISNGFSKWGGGIDFIRQIALYISFAESKNTINKSLILPGHDWISTVKDFIYPLAVITKDVRYFRKPRFSKRFSFSENYFRQTFSDYESKYNLIYSGSTFKSQLKAVKKLSPDVILPLFEVPPVNFDIPWIGYMYDFQHKYLPDFFLIDEIQARNKSFAEMLTRSNHIIVNAKSVANDARRFHPESDSKIHSMPFSPCPSKLLLNLDIDARQKYGINRPYFMISNQFWKHKDHITAFKAYARYLELGGRAILICTGETVDYRFPNYFLDLIYLLDDLKIRNNVLILGHIPKNDQISLMKKAIAIVQPTLFEGGPGGGAAYDAIALGIPVIASNIPVNLEMNCGDVTFFAAGNDEELCYALMDRGLKTYDVSKAILWKEGVLRAKKSGNFLLNIAYNAI